MTNFEKIKSLTIEEMAHLNVRAFTYMNGYRTITDFYTTNQTVFDTREAAEEYEIKWLNGEVERKYGDDDIYMRIVTKNIECNVFNINSYNCSVDMVYSVIEYVMKNQKERPIQIELFSDENILFAKIIIDYHDHIYVNGNKLKSIRENDYLMELIMENVDY